jgi:hypothetical protein
MYYKNSLKQQKLLGNVLGIDSDLIRKERCQRDKMPTRKYERQAA